MFRYWLVGFGLLPAVPAAVAADLADPTRPPAGYQVAPDGAPARQELPRVSAIRIGRGSRVAIIDGTPVAVGDSVTGYRVLAIETDGVKLLHNGAELTVSLRPRIKTAIRRGR